MNSIPSVRYARYAKAGLGALFLAAFVYVIARSFYRVAIAHQAESAMFASAVWGLLTLASFAGWGSALNAWLFPRERADWGLRCAWGYGIALAFGGLFCAFGLASRKSLLFFVGVGLVFLSASLVRSYRIWSRRSSVRQAALARNEFPYWVGVAGISSLGFLQYLASILDGTFNPYDDGVAYFGFAREIVQSGTLSQPFSMRRISSYGGKSLLDAIHLSIDVPNVHLHVVDTGIALLASLALIAGHVRSSRWSSRAISLLAMLLLVSLPNLRLNSATSTTGVVLFLGLYRTMTWGPITRTFGMRSAIPVALLAAGACTLRQNYLVPVGVALVVAYGSHLANAVTFRPFRIRRPELLDTAWTAGLTFAFLAPWCAMAQRWGGTFLFPITRGNFDASYGFFEPLKSFESLHYIWQNAAYGLPVKAVPLFLVAALTLNDRLPRKPYFAAMLGAFAGFAMLIHSYPASDAPNLGRYYFGFTCAALIATALIVSDLAAQKVPSSPRLRSIRVAAVPLVIVALGLQIYDDRERTFQMIDGFITAIDTKEALPKPWEVSTLDPKYVALQAPIPPKAKVAIMVDNPAELNYARNRIANLDMVGAVSPPPGLPLNSGGQAVAHYLLNHGYRYLIVVSPDQSSSLYSRPTWKKQEQHSAPVWMRTAHFYLEAFDDVDEIRKSYLHLADVGSVSTIDLGTPVN